MKTRYILQITALAAMIVTSCQMEKIELFKQQEAVKKTHRLIINADSGAETRTSITAVAGGYKINWDPGDYIVLHECAPEAAEDDYDAVRTYESRSLLPEDIVEDKAGFAFDEVEDRTASSYSYIATYGSYSQAEYFDWSSDEWLYEDWATTFGYTGEYLDPHMVIQMGFPTWQTPLADTFDPWADLMVSHHQVVSEQLSGEASFKFGRIGAIVKMTLTGLDDYKGCQTGEIRLTFGESVNIPNRIKYDPILNKYVSAGLEERSGGGMSSNLMVDGCNIVIKEDGTADVWLRLPSGELTDWFRVDICLFSDTEEHYLARYIDLEKLNRTLIFKDGEMTTFSIGGFAIADVEPVGGIEYIVNEAMDGFTATWTGVEHASGYECFIISDSDVKTVLSPVDNGDGTYSVSVENGMTKGIYTIHVRPVPEEGHELIDIYHSTETLLIGIPKEWWFAHDCFGSMESSYIEGTDGEYIIDFSPGKVRFKNLTRRYDSSWQALEATGEWFMYSTEPLKMHSIELWSKDDSHKNFKVYASTEPGAESLELTGEVIEVSEIDAGSGSYRYNHVHKRVRYTFPEPLTHHYYTIKGSSAGIVMTSQYTFVYYFDLNL